MLWLINLSEDKLCSLTEGRCDFIPVAYYFNNIVVSINFGWYYLDIDTIQGIIFVLVNLSEDKISSLKEGRYDFISITYYLNNIVVSILFGRYYLDIDTMQCIRYGIDAKYRNVSGYVERWMLR